MRGTIELFEVCGADWRPLFRLHNNILYSGYDCLARAAAGDVDYVINGMYVEYKNGVPTPPVIPLDRTPAYYEALTTPYGYVRVRTFSQPVYTSSDAAKYAGNVVTFMGVTDGTSAGGAPIVDGTSQFFSLALVAIPAVDNRLRDTLAAAGPLMNGAVFAPVTKLANSQLGFKWSLQLGG